MDDAGEIMSAIAEGSDTDTALAKGVSISEDRRKAILALLNATGYLHEADHRYLVGVPVLTERDKPMVDASLKLSREIMTGWLRDNYPSMEKELIGLSPMRNGLPFSLAFSEVWHYTFGFATKSLAESGFCANPRAHGSRYEGYVPRLGEFSSQRPRQVTDTGRKEVPGPRLEFPSRCLQSASQVPPPRRSRLPYQAPSRKLHGRQAGNRRKSPKMRVLLISAANDAGAATPLPLGLACVAGAAEIAGHDVRLLTLGTDADCGKSG